MKVHFNILVLSLMLTASAVAEDCISANKLVQQGVGGGLSLTEQQEKFERAVKLCPSMAEAHYNLGVTLLKNGNLNSAEVQFESAKKLNDSNEVRFALAVVELSSGDYPQAEDNLNYILSSDSQNIAAIEALALVKRKVGKFDEAEALLLRAIQLDSARPTLFLRMGQLFQEQERYAEAEASYRAAIERQPESLAAYQLLFQLYKAQEKSKEWPAAVSLYLSSKQTPPEVFLWTASVLQAEGRLEEAERVLQQLDTPNATAAAFLGFVKFKLNKKEEAVSQLELALTKYQQLEDVRRVLAWIYLEQNRNADAEAMMEGVSNSGVKDAFSLNNLGVLLEQKGDVEKALELYSESLQLNPKLVEARSNKDRLESSR